MPRVRPECTADGCTKPNHSLGYCCTHYARFRKYGSPELPAREPSPPTSWVTRWGYRHLYLPDHPMSNSSGAVYEHRLVMADHIGRDLLPSESVHHVNGDRLDNRSSHEIRDDDGNGPQHRLEHRRDRRDHRITGWRPIGPPASSRAT